MFENIKNNDLLVIVLVILALYAGNSLYTYCTKPKVREGFSNKCNKNACSQDKDCCSAYYCAKTQSITGGITSVTQACYPRS